MPDPIATPEDVLAHSNVSLDPEEIHPYLDDAAWELSQHTDPSAMDDALRARLERWLAELEILTVRTGERSTSSEQLGDAQASYEASRIEELRDKIHKYDPTGELVDDDIHIGVSVLESR